jgi:carbon-monoxide dehydrogenase iron sulfur subunit
MKMPRRYIVCDPDRCLGCQICEFACSATKGKTCDPSHSCIHIVNLEPVGSMAIACVLCEKAPCVTACSREALFKAENGIIQVDEKKCNGCSWCIEACKFGAITLHPTKETVAICDLCDGDPECVKLCPFEDAIAFGTLDDVANSFRRQKVVRLLRELIEKS